MKPSFSSRVLRIGVTSRHGSARWIEENTRHYLDTLSEFGAKAVVLSPDTSLAMSGAPEFRPDSNGRLPAEVVDHLDGLILAGGGDVDPVFFGATLDGANANAIDRKRDELELNLARVAMQQNLPLFGICRGCQVLNVAAGGGMIQHFNGHKAPEGTTAYHGIQLVEGTWFQRMIGQPVMTVNSFHHQGVNEACLARLFQPAAFAQPDSWLIEAFESTAHDWVLGVQWHPERLFELDGDNHALWRSFLQACENRENQGMLQ